MNVKEIGVGIKKRLPGGRLYQLRKVTSEMKCGEVFWNVCRQYYNAAYFKGAKWAGKNLYMKLGADENIQLAGLSFPIPKTNSDFKVLMTEIPDLLFPFKFAGDSFNYSKIEKCFDEGPYELNKNVCLSSGDVVIDCGANMGLFSNIAIAKSCEVYAFEPNKAMRERYLNKYSSNALHIEEYALSDSTNGEEMFVEVENHESGSYIADIDLRGTGYCNFQVEEGRKKYHDNISQYKVKVTTLDDWADKNKISRIDFIKADIEGAERLMLKGAWRVLQTYAPKLSICTYHFEDDPVVLERIIYQANPNYIIEHKYKKLYAYVP